MTLTEERESPNHLKLMITILGLIIIVALLLGVWQKIKETHTETVHPYGTTATTGTRNIPTTVTLSGSKQVSDLTNISINNLETGTLYLTKIDVDLPIGMTVEDYRSSFVSKNAWKGYGQDGETLPTVSFDSIDPEWCPSLTNIDSATTGSISYCVAFVDKNSAGNPPSKVVYDERSEITETVTWD